MLLMSKIKINNENDGYWSWIHLVLSVIRYSRVCINDVFKHCNIKCNLKKKHCIFLMQSCVQNTDTFITFAQKMKCAKCGMGEFAWWEKRSAIYSLVVMNSKTFFCFNKIKAERFLLWYVHGTSCYSNFRLAIRKSKVNE